MTQIEIPADYLVELAKQFIFISAFLGGFVASVLGTLIISKRNNKVLKALIIGCSLSAASFVVTVFAMTQVVVISLPGYPLEINPGQTDLTRLIGGIAFMLGILALTFVIGMSGWMHSKAVGITTTAIGILALVLIFMCMQ